PNLNILPNRSSVFQRILFRLGGQLSQNIQRKVYNLVLNSIYGKVIKEVDATVCIGGSMFIQPTSDILDKNLLFYKFVIENNGAKPTYFLGCNFGPYHTRAYKETFKEIFSKSTDLCFRDKKSFLLFDSPHNVRWNPDIVFGMEANKSEKIRGSVGFVLVDPSQKINGFSDQQGYIKKCAEIISYHIGKKSKVFLFSFCQKEGDEDIIEKILSRVNDEIINDITIIKYRGDIEEFLASYSRVELMYCGRFHAMILSMLYNQSIIPISYSSKMDNTLSDIDFKGPVFKIERFLQTPIDELLGVSDENLYDISEHCEKSKIHFEKLDRFLKNVTK